MSKSPAVSGTVYIVVNNLGILLGIYRDAAQAVELAKEYIRDGTTGSFMETSILVYRAETRQVGLTPLDNRFMAIWKAEIPTL